MEFNPNTHVFKSPKVRAIINEAIDFLNRTPAYQLPPPESFAGTGVYCLYYLANFDLYRNIACLNITECTQPIYVGKAVPKGWRTFREGNESDSTLYGRLREHARGIKQGAGLEVKDFKCRLMILKGEESSMITIVEAALIRKYRLLWNAVVDGFGNHDPGSGRYDQAKSEWDVLHPGRTWEEKLRGKSPVLEGIKTKIRNALKP
ncbi:MAG: Eco29kI family restriction endonuclease [Nitrospirae bacterium]|nr:Eco29kI family restriction endonuclease [Nitrospirota bacterium]